MHPPPLATSSRSCMQTGNRASHNLQIYMLQRKLGTKAFDAQLPGDHKATLRCHVLLLAVLFSHLAPHLRGPTVQGSVLCSHKGRVCSLHRTSCSMHPGLCWEIQYALPVQTFNSCIVQADSTFDWLRIVHQRGSLVAYERTSYFPGESSL